MQAHQKPHLTFRKKVLQSVVAAALMVSCPASIIAKDYNQFTPVEEYPTAKMPFAIVDIAIGQTKDEAKALMEKQLGREVAFETGVLETSSPGGNHPVDEPDGTHGF